MMAAPKQSASTIPTQDSNWTDIELLNLNTWIYCICLVDFDLTEGQITKFVYPFDILSHKEKTNIANLSFPDTHTSNHDVYNAKFVFRFRARMMNKKKQKRLSGKCKISYSHRHKSHPYLFGYVYFKQKPDKSIERGYFQKAIVIITPIPYVHVFIRAAELIGSLYFEYNYGLKILNTACHNICSWSSPSIEGEANLPLLGNVIRVALSPKGVPPSASILLPGNKDHHKKTHIQRKEEQKYMEKENGYQIIDKYATLSAGGCFQEVNIYRYFHVVLGNLWCLWELALTGQPLLVVGSSAEQCSHAVLGIMSLISPITYHGDFRPYFTVYDDDFKHFCNLHDRDMLPPLILGVTNPFFLKVMPKFPHVLVLSDSNCASTVTNVTSADKDPNENKQNDDAFVFVNKSDNMGKKRNISDKANKGKSVMTIHMKTTNMDQHQPSVKKNAQRSWGAVANSHNTIISNTTPCLFPDDQVLSRLLTSELEIEQVSILNNATLRKYFQQLTEKFLEPFEEYFTFKAPSGTWNPYLNPPNLKTFHKDVFLNTIRDIPKSFLNEIPLRMSPLPTGKRSILVKLYSKFLKSPHFPSWFNRKRERAKRKCDKIIHKMIRKIKFERLVEGKPVREGIKMYQTIHRHMNNNNQSAKPKADLNDVLIRHRAVLRSALPSQIIEALDEQVGKMRKDQIQKRKEWQIKYQEHLKQQRTIYNLNHNDKDDDDDDDEEDEEDIMDKASPSPSQHSIESKDESVSNSKALPSSLLSIRAKSDPNFNKKSKNNKDKKRLKYAKTPNQMLTSPSSSGSETSSSMPSNIDKSNVSTKVKKRKLAIFDTDSTPSIFASAISFGAGLNGGLAPNIHHNIHKYHRYNSRDMNKRQQRNGGRATATKTNRIKEERIGTRQRSLSVDLLIETELEIDIERERASSEGILNRMESVDYKMSIFSRDDSFQWFSNNSPKMTDILFDLSNANDFVATNGAKSVVTNSFTATHDDDFKLYDNHF